MYDLLTGHPPFAGKTAIEVITKHASEAVTPPDKIVRDVPKSLSVILLKMMAKKPQDRYSSMDEVIDVLEEYIAASNGGIPFSPQDYHVRGLELSVNQFHSATWVQLRQFAIWTYFGLGIAGLLAAIWVSHLKGLARTIWDAHVKIAEGFLGLMVLTFLSYMVVAGIGHGTYFSRRVRQFVSATHVVDWIKATLSGIILVGFLSVFHLHWVWLGALVISFLIALAFYCTIDRALKKERQTALLQVEGMLKSMRQHGMDEDAVRQFVCDHLGAQWEEFYEELFGYEAVVAARRLKGLEKRGRDRSSWGAMRDPIINAIDTQMHRWQDERDRQYFARIEERKLLEQGFEPAQAQVKAQKSQATSLPRQDASRKPLMTAMKSSRKALHPIRC